MDIVLICAWPELCSWCLCVWWCITFIIPSSEESAATHTPRNTVARAAWKTWYWIHIRQASSAGVFIFLVTNVKFLSDLLKALICFKGTISDWCFHVWVRLIIDDDCWVLLWDLGSFKCDTCKIHHWIEPGEPKRERKKHTQMPWEHGVCACFSCKV